MDMGFPCCNRHLAEKLTALTAVVEGIARQQSALGAILEAKAAKNQPFLVLLTAAEEDDQLLDRNETMESLMKKAADINRILLDELSMILADPSYASCQPETTA